MGEDMADHPDILEMVQKKALEGNKTVKPSGKRGFKDVMMIVGVLLAVSLFMFTFGLLVGRQITIAELGHDSPQHEATEESHGDEPSEHDADDHGGTPPQGEESHAPPVHEESHAEHDEKGTKEQTAGTHVEKVAAETKKEVTGAPQPEPKVAPHPMTAELEQQMKPASDKAHLKGKKGVPPEVAKLFEETEAQRKVASKTPSKNEEKMHDPSQYKWTLQVGSYPTEDEANRRVRALTSKGYTSFFEETVVKGATWYRVNVGRFLNPGEAQAMGRKLQESGQVSTFFAREVAKADK